MIDKIIDGKSIATKLQNEIAKEILQIKKRIIIYHH